MASFSVAPSPFNPVKFELGIWIIVMIPLGLFIHAQLESVALRLIILSAFSGVASLRILWRINQIQRQVRLNQNKVDQAQRQP